MNGKDINEGSGVVDLLSMTEKAMPEQPDNAVAAA